MLLDYAKNWAEATVSTGYDASATSIVLTSGHGANLPSAPFNVIWWNSTDYSNPADDPNKEIVRVTAKSTDTLTVTRAQEGTSGSIKNTSGKTYKMWAGPTAKIINDDIAPILHGSTPGAGFFYEWDDFILDSSATRFTKLSWYNGPGGGGALNNYHGEANHPGIWRLETGTVLDAYAHCALFDYANGFSQFGRLDTITNWEFHHIFRPNSVTNVYWQVGLDKEIWGGTGGAVLKLDTSVNATARYYVAGTYDSQPGVTPTATDWWHLRIRSTTVGIWEFSVSINGGAWQYVRTFGPSGADVTVTLPTNTLLSPFHVIWNRSAGTSRTLDVDFWSGFMRLSR